MFFRDPDGHLIEISEASGRFLGTDSRRLPQKGRLHWAIRTSEGPPPIGSRIRFGGHTNLAGRRCTDMADKSPRKQNKGKKLSAKEKKAKKKAKEVAKATPTIPKPLGK